MKTNKQFSAALSQIAAWIGSHPEIAPEKLEWTTDTLLGILKKQGRDVTKENLEAAFKAANEQVRNFDPEREFREIEKLVKEIDGWSADKMKENCKDPEVDAAVNAVLEKYATMKAARKSAPVPVAPKPQPKPAVDPLIANINRMSADEFKRVLTDPTKARGIENVLRGSNESR